LQNILPSTLAFLIFSNRNDPKHSLICRDISMKIFQKKSAVMSCITWFLISIFRELIKRFVIREYYTCISEVTNRHVQNPLWNPFVDLWRDLWGTSACRSNYVDIIRNYYRNLQKAQSDANWSRLTCRCAIITLCYVKETSPLGNFGYIDNSYNEIFFLRVYIWSFFLAKQWFQRDNLWYANIIISHDFNLWLNFRNNKV